MAYIQEVVGILDRSGSMNGKEEDTVGGINSMIEELKTNKSNNDIINVSLKLFDHEEKLLWKSIPLDKVEKLKVSDFNPRGQTALLDALGNTLNFFMTKRLYDDNCFNKCLIYLATDGLENASKIYKHSDIKNMIDVANKKYNIDIIYLGANQDAILEANRIGINADRAINYAENNESTNAVYRAVGRIASEQRSNTNSFRFSNLERESSNTNNNLQTSLDSNNVQPPPITRSNNIY